MVEQINPVFVNNSKQLLGLPSSFFIVNPFLVHIPGLPLGYDFCFNLFFKGVPKSCFCWLKDL